MSDHDCRFTLLRPGPPKRYVCSICGADTAVGTDGQPVLEPGQISLSEILQSDRTQRGQEDLDRRRREIEIERAGLRGN